MTGTPDRCRLRSPTRTRSRAIQPPDPADLIVDRLGPATRPSPLGLSTVSGDRIADYCPDDARTLFDPSPSGADGPSFEMAGPREQVFFDGPRSHAAIVTCGGLSPGLNNIIRALVRTLRGPYGVRNVTGFRFGYAGLAKDADPPPMNLDRAAVHHIDRQGGTILGSSRGPVEAGEMVDTLDRLGVDLLFCIGGDGTMRGAQAIYDEVKARGRQLAVIGLPKTIDNDLPLVERTFGFDTAVGIACEALRAAAIEAECAPRGVGLVRLMGRHAGYIAAAAALTTREVDLVLVPELSFALDGPKGVYAWIREVLARQGRAVVVVAEGAGQDHLEAAGEADPSGNRKLGDIGVFLRDAMKAAFADDPINLKYIDPSYIIRAAPANTADARLCGELAEDAVHAAMSGRTGMVVGLWNGQRTHVPLGAVAGRTRRLDLDGALWRSVVQTTGQPKVFEGE